MATEVDDHGAARAAHRVNRRSQSEGRGGGRSEAPAPVTLFGRAADRYRKSVWAPVVSKALGILAGMIALAGIGASSLARGSATPLPSALPAQEARAQMGPSAGPHHERAAQAAAGPGAAEGEGTADAGAGDAGASDAGAGDASADASPEAGDGRAPGQSAGLTADGRVILNLARFEDLRTLSGIGPKKAQAILDLRTRLGGRFRRVTDLLRVKGIGPKTLAKLKDKLVLDPPADGGS